MKFLGSIQNWCNVEMERKMKETAIIAFSSPEGRERHCFYVTTACTVHTATRPERITCEYWCVQYVSVNCPQCKLVCMWGVFIWHKLMSVCLLCVCVRERLSTTSVHKHICVILQDLRQNLQHLPKVLYDLTRPVRLKTHSHHSAAYHIQHVKVDCWVQNVWLWHWRPRLASRLLPIVSVGFF